MSDEELTPGEEELTEAEEALMVEGAGLMVDAVGQLAAADLDRLLRGLNPVISGDVVKELLGNKLDPRRMKNVGNLLVGPLRRRPPARLHVLLERLSTGILETFHKELGEERFENPTLADLREVLDAVLAQHPAGGVRCTLAWVVAGAMPAAEAARDVLYSDERLRLDAWPEAPAPD